MHTFKFQTEAFKLHALILDTNSTINKVTVKYFAGNPSQSVLSGYDVIKKIDV